jgi:D-alanine-D-alanine ligase
MSQLLNKVAVLFGGSSGEREVSLMSGTAILEALLAKNINAHGFDPATQSIDTLQREGYTAAYIALHGRFGEDGTVQGALELLGIPYTGSGVMASAIAIDKQMTKRLWESEQIPTPAWQLTASAAETQLAFKRFQEDGHRMIVKPTRDGSSLGLSRISDASECEAAFLAASQLDGRALCEAWIEGDEVTCALLDDGNGLRALPLIRIAAPEGNYDFFNKYYSDAVRYHIPSGLAYGEELLIQTLALKAFESIGCRGWGRADVMIDGTTRQPYLLEVNTSPGMTGHSLVPMAAKAIGLSFSELCLQVLRSARLDGDVRREKP